MARMVLTVGGQLIGNAIAPGIGGAIGGAIGSIAGALLFPPPPTYGPKPQDTQVSPGTYGSPIAIAYGLGLISADLIWVKGNQKDVRENKQSTGGKGLGGPTHITYEQFATFAVLISDNEIRGVRRIYFGKDLVYDGTSEAIEDAINSGSELPLTGELEGLTFRVYTGTSTQDPDPAIQAEDEHASALRGMAYAVFEDVPLEKWGNQIPGDGVPVLFEVTEGDPEEFKLGLASTSASNKLVSYDPTRKRLFIPTGDIAVRVYDASGGLLVREEDLTGVENVWKSTDYGSLSEMFDTVNESGTPGSQSYNDIGPAVAPDGSFHIITETVDGIGIGARLYFASGLMVDSETGQWLATLSTGRTLDAGTGYGFAIGHGTRGVLPTDHKLREVDWLTPDPLTGLRRYLYLRTQNHGGGFFGAVGFSDRGAVDISGAFKITDANDSLGAASSIYVDVNAAGDTIFALYRDDSNVWKLARIPISGPLGGSGKSEFWGFAYEPDLTAAVPSFPDGSVKEMFYDREHDHVVCRSTDAIVIMDTGLNLVARLDGKDFNSDGVLGRNNAELGKMWFFSRPGSIGSNVNRLRSVSTEDAAIVDNYDLGDWGLSEQTDGAPIFEVGSGVFLGYASSGGTGNPTYENQPFLLFRDRFGIDKIPLADVLEDAALRAGLSASDIDLTAVTRQIYGAPQKSSNVTARGVWEDLLLITGHDAMMVDGKLTVRPRATATSGTLDDKDLGADGKRALKRKTNPADAPRRVELSYRSIPAHLEPAHQADEFPFEVLPYGRVHKFETAMLLDDNEAWPVVQELLSISSSERTEFEIALPYTRGDIEPGEIWTIDADGGLHDMRIREIRGGRTMRMKGTAAWPFLTAAGTPIDSTRPAPSLAEVSVTEFELIDSNMWRDTDDDAAIYVVGWPRRSNAKWEGGLVFRDDEEFALIEQAAAAGQASTALGDVESCNVWDRKNTLTFTPINGTPENATELEVLSGANPIWVYAGGDWELVQFATAVENGDGSWTLSNLLRGRRGTEHLTGSHLIGDRIIWASADTAVRQGGDQIGTELGYISATVGSFRNETTRRNFTNTARSLRPYSPKKVDASRDGSGSVSADITRRSRLQGDVSKTNVPLAEDTEAYEVDVLDGPDGNVLRTISISGTNSFTYSDSDQTTDFGSTQSSIDVKVYQISATYGRGVELETVI